MTDLEFVNQIKEMRADKVNGLAKMREFLKVLGHLDRLFDLAIKQGSKKPPRQKARSALAAGFPDQPQIDRAKGHWAMMKRHDLVMDAQAQADAFRDYHTGKGTLAADWPATWGTWFRNAPRINRQPWGQPTQPNPGETLDVWRWRIRVFRQGDTEENLAPGYWKDAWGPKPGEAGCRAPVN